MTKEACVSFPFHAQGGVRSPVTGFASRGLSSLVSPPMSGRWKKTKALVKARRERDKAANFDQAMNQILGQLERSRVDDTFVWPKPPTVVTRQVFVFREGAREDEHAVSFEVRAECRQQSWGVFLSRVKHCLRLTDVEGVYTSCEAMLPVIDVKSLIHGQCYMVRPTEGCALLRSLTIDKTGHYPSSQAVERFPMGVAGAGGTGEGRGRKGGRY